MCIVDLNCPACAGSGTEIIITEVNRYEPKPPPLRCRACDGRGTKIGHGSYLISVAVGAAGYVAWTERADGKLIKHIDGHAAPSFGTHTYQSREHAMVAAIDAIDRGELC